MLKPILKASRTTAKLERGQVIVIVALSAILLIAIVGLVMDVGLMFIGNARLRRATDAAALAAALKYRIGVQTTTLDQVATEFLVLNGVTLDAAHPVTVDTCITDPGLCLDSNGTFVARKLVRVRDTATIKLAFLPVIGINNVTISAEATSEAASLDLVLVIDTSESMTQDIDKTNFDNNVDSPLWPLRDPSICNDDQKSINAINASTMDPVLKAAYIADIQTDGIPGECHPFEEVKKAAVDFVDRLYFPYDRVAVVTFDKAAHSRLDFLANCSPGPCTTDQIKATIEGKIKNLNVYGGEDECPDGQPCRPYCTKTTIQNGYCDNQPGHPLNYLASTVSGALYKGVFDCGDGYYFNPGNPQDPSGCTTTDLGDGLKVAGSEFGVSPRQGSLWVVVLLTDGSANGGTNLDDSPICPNSTWGATPFCRDLSTSTRHCALAATRDRCILNGNGAPVDPTNPFYDPLYPYNAGVWDLNNYDADDYARDMADYVGIDLQSLMFSIGLGDLVDKPASDPAGQRLLKYAAEFGNGLYYKASAANLGDIFKKIGDNIATRLTR